MVWVETALARALGDWNHNRSGGTWTVGQEELDFLKRARHKSVREGLRVWDDDWDEESGCCHPGTESLASTQTWAIGQCNEMHMQNCKLLMKRHSGG